MRKLMRKVTQDFNKRKLFLLSILLVIIVSVLFTIFLYTKTLDNLDEGTKYTKEILNKSINKEFNDLQKDLDFFSETFAYNTYSKTWVKNRDISKIDENMGKKFIERNVTNVDSILITNEDLTFVYDYGLLEGEKVLKEDLFLKTLRNNEKDYGIKKIDGDYFMYHATPILDENFSNPFGLYIVFTEMNGYIQKNSSSELYNNIIFRDISEINSEVEEDNIERVKILDTDFELEYQNIEDIALKYNQNYKKSFLYLIGFLLLILILTLGLIFASTNNKIDSISCQLKDYEETNTNFRIKSPRVKFLKSFNELEKYINKLLGTIGSKVESLNENYIETINLIKKAVEFKDAYTSEHSYAVSLYSQELAKMIEGYDDYEGLEIASKFHDIGKLFTPVDILNKSGKLTDEEYAIIKQHPMDGYKILSSNTHFKESVDGVKYHHERWDGKGYPEGLKGNEIPMIAQIIAVADVYDALTSSRAYRDALSHEKAYSIITDGEGSLFSSQLVDAFKVKEKTIKEISLGLKRENYYQIYKNAQGIKFNKNKEVNKRKKTSKQKISEESN